MKLDDIVRVGELARRGYGSSEIAAELGVSKSSVLRARKSRPDLFEPAPEPGSLEHVRQVHLGALDAVLADGRPDWATRQRAAEALTKLGARGASASGPQTIFVGTLDRCPSCGSELTSTLVQEPEETPQAS